MTYIFNTIFLVSIMEVSLFYSLSVLLMLLKHIKLIVKRELLLENIMQNRTSVFDKKN